MAIQDIQVLMYTNTHCFCIFQFFFIFFLNGKQINKTENKQNILNKAKHKTRLTQSSKAKHKSNANKNKKRRVKK